MELKDIIKDNVVNFSHYQGGYFYYNIETKEGTFQFPVQQSDIEATDFPTLLAQDKAIYFMRYIRVAIKENKFNKITLDKI